MSIHREHHCNERIEKHFHRGSSFLIIGELRTPCQEDITAGDSSLERGVSAIKA